MNLAGMVKGFVGSMGQWIAQGAPVVTPEQFESRAGICLDCPRWDRAAFGGRGRCLECGCSSMKLYLATSSCPVGKWSPQVQTKGVSGGPTNARPGG